MSPNRKSTRDNNKLVHHFIISGLDETAELESIGDDSVEPFQRFYKSKLLSVYPNNAKDFTTADLNTLIHPYGVRLQTKDQCLNEVDYHPFIVTHEDASTIYGATLTFYEKVVDSRIIAAVSVLQNMYCTENQLQRCLFDVHINTLMMTKSITFLCKVPLLETCKRLLISLHEQACYTLPPWKCGEIESYVHNALEEITLPPPGFSIRVTLSDEAQLVCQRPDKKELPLFDLSLEHVLELITTDNLISVITCALLEYQIILYSQDLERLMLVGETIQALLFPFEWPFLYAPILPYDASEYVLDVPQPYIVGVHSNMPISVEDLKANSSQMCILNLDDKDDFVLPEDMNTFPFHEQMVKDIDVMVDAYNDGTWFSNDPKHSDESTLSTKLELLHSTNHILNKVVEIVCKTGVMDSVHDIESRLPAEFSRSCSVGDSVSDAYTRDLVFNSELRHLFLHHMLELMRSFAACVRLPDQAAAYLGLDNYFSTRESRFDFDGTTFVSEKPSSDMGFYSRLVETQAFCYLVDETIGQQWTTDKKASDCLSNLELFQHYLTESAKISSSSTTTHEYHAAAYSRSSLAMDAAKHIENRYVFVDSEATKPHPLDGATSIKLNNNRITGNFPTLSRELLKRNRSKIPITNRKHDLIRRAKSKSEVILKKTLSNMSAPNFVATLQKECKSKSKRLLLTKLSRKTVEDLGIKESNHIEENTLISSLCDMFERTFTHGLLCKQGKSHLWNFLLAYKAKAEQQDILLSYCDLCTPRSVVDDIRLIQTLERVCTDMGKARAFVRLCLEKKLLNQTFRLMLHDRQLLDTLYKKDAFLMSCEEVEMYLFHVLSLNTVDFYCFTENFVDAVIAYKVHIISSNGFKSNCWLDIEGSLCTTRTVAITCNKFSFKHKNIGHLNTMRIGQDNTSSITSKWNVDHIIIINTVTNQVNKFTCGESISIDGGQRLLIAEKVPQHSVKETIEKAQSNSPSIKRKPKLTVDDVNQIHDNLRNSINLIVKNFLSADVTEKLSLTIMLCGEQGFIRYLEELLSFGFKSSRFLRTDYSLWDFITKANEYFKELLENKVERKVGDKVEQSLVAYIRACNLIGRHSLIGKHGMYQVFILVAIRDKYLAKWIRLMSKTPVTTQMYEGKSFMRDNDLHLQLLQMVSYLLLDINIRPDVSLFQGINV